MRLVQLRPALLLAVVVAAAANLWWSGASFGRHVYEEEPFAVDARPARSVLFLGNSRLYVNNLPKAVREIADSAGSRLRFDIHMRAWGDATLTQHWDDSGDQAALQQSWDEVILQTESGTFGDEGRLRDFNEAGGKLARAAHSAGARVAVLCNWMLSPRYFTGADPEAAARLYGERTVEETRAFAARTGAGVIDLEGAFAEAEARAPHIALTSDGNHPTHAGTYLAALVAYGYLSREDIAKASWRPDGVDERAAALLKEIAAHHLR